MYNSCGVQWIARSVSQPRKPRVADALFLCGSWSSCLCTGSWDSCLWTLLLESRSWGHEAKLRPHTDSEPDLVLIPDATQTALSDGVISAWQTYAKIVSVQYAVHFQARLTACISLYTGLRIWYVTLHVKKVLKGKGRANRVQIIIAEAIL